MLYIGIDLGTSAVKLLLLRENGKIENIVSETYPIYFPQKGYSEQNPEDWFRATLLALKKLLLGFDKKEVVAIAIAGQMHGSVILDDKDNIIRPAILWNDGRSIKETKYLNESLGIDILDKHTANMAFAGFTLPKLLWIKNNEPELFKRISKIMLPKDYINYKLSGTYASDFSDASGTLLLDVKNKFWSYYMCEICGIGIQALPKLYESFDIIGELKNDIANELGLSPKVKILAGAGDNAAAAIGTATLNDGSCNISLGTSGTIFMPSKDFIYNSNKSLHNFAHANGNFHLMACILSAASCNKWWLEDILQTKNYILEENSISTTNLGKNSIFFLPYLMGERSPLNDSLARSAFIGMSMDSKKEDLYQAILEGVAFAMKDCMEIAKSSGINIKESTLCGGGAKSPLWQKILANVLNIDIKLPLIEEGPSYGMAVLCSFACGKYATIEEACQNFISTKSIISPDKELVDLYEERYNIFKNIYPALAPIFHSL